MAPDKPPRRKPNRQSIGIRPHKHVELTKAEMQADLKKAVENTGAPSEGDEEC